MYINFNSKYFTLASIALGFYLFYQMQAAKGPQINDFDDSAIVPKAKYVMELDPNKPNSERTLFEKVIYNYTISKQAEIKMKRGDKVDDTIYSEVPISIGDRATINLKEITTATQSDVPLTIIVGNNILHKSIEDALIGMKQGDKKNVDHVENDRTIKKFEIEVISVTPKTRAK